MDPLNRRKYTKEALDEIRKAHCASCCGNFIDVPKTTLLTRDIEDDYFYFCSMSCAEYYIMEFREEFATKEKPKKKLTNIKKYWN